MDTVGDFDNSGAGPLRVPGAPGCVPLTWQLPTSNRFRHGANDWAEPERLTAREVSMLRIMNALTDKPSWEHKIFDEDIVGRWRVEADRECEEDEEAPGMTDATWRWIVQELRDKAVVFGETGMVMGLDTGSRVCKSDTLVERKLKEEIMEAVRPLLESGDKDWHPGSDGKVLNFVHPSMYPLICGRTAVLSQGGTVGLDDFLDSYGQGLPQPMPPAEDDEPTPRWGWAKPSNTRWSQRYQWLPCEVEFTGATGTDVRITSYVNNLHPERHKQLYAAIEKLVARVIPAWNEVLVRGERGRTPLRIRTFGAERDGDMPEWTDDLSCYVDDDEGDEEEREAYYQDLAKVRQYMRRPDRERPDSEYSTTPRSLSLEDNWAEEDLRWGVKWKFERISNVVHPEPGQAFSYEDWKAGRTKGAVIPDRDGNGRGEEHTRYAVRLEDEFRKRGLQVIVKISGTELNDEKPAWHGGSWHVEGMVNEHIVATAIYYYDVDNTGESTVHFRHEAELDPVGMQYEQHEHGDLAEVFGAAMLVEGEPGLQDLGGVTTRDGRLLAFPNTLQHCVSAFERENEGRDGHRRMVVLWLVDPNYRVVSTRNVPPQRGDWWADAVMAGGGIGKLPVEVTEMVVKEAGGWPMGRAEADDGGADGGDGQD